MYLQFYNDEIGGRNQGYNMPTFYDLYQHIPHEDRKLIDYDLNKKSYGGGRYTYHIVVRHEYSDGVMEDLHYVICLRLIPGPQQFIIDSFGCKPKSIQ